ncbi:MAG: hypothetical protein ACKON9_12240, partial [Planctomycetaceae bacterium]
MRWKWIVPRLLIAFSVWAFIHWGMDPLLRWTAVSALQSVTGARVDIRRVVTTFFPPSIDFQRMTVQVTGVWESGGIGFLVDELDVGE